MHTEQRDSVVVMSTYSTVDPLDGFTVTFTAGRRLPWSCTCPAAGRPEKAERLAGQLYCKHISRITRNLPVELAGRLASSIYRSLTKAQKNKRHTHNTRKGN